MPKTESDIFRIGHFPQHTSNSKLREDLSWIKSRHPLSGGLTEMSKRKDDVQAILGPTEDSYRTFWDRHGGRPIEIPMFANVEEIGDFGYNYLPISPGTPGVSFVKPRGISVLRYRYRNKKIAHIHTHWDAVLQNKSTGEVFSKADRVAFAKRSSKAIEKMAHSLKRNGYAVFITGDFNYRDFPWLDRFQLWRHSPQRLFKRLGLRWKEERLDYLAYDTGLVKLERYKVIKPRTPGNHGDHPYMIGDFSWTA